MFWGVSDWGKLSPPPLVAGKNIDHVTKYLGARHHLMESVKVRTTWVKWFDIYFQKTFFTLESEFYYIISFMRIVFRPK